MKMGCIDANIKIMNNEKSPHIFGELNMTVY